MAKQQRSTTKSTQSPISSKRELILQAARELFLAHGFASTSVDAVTALSGVSKPTVYSHFATKDELLEAVVRAESERADIPVEFQPTGETRQDLQRAAQALLTMALSAETLAWDRMIAGEARRKPALGKLFFDCGPRRLLIVLAEFFRNLAASQTIHIPDPEEAAEFFFGMVVGLPLLRAQLTGQSDNQDVAEKRCREIADRFLRAYGPVSQSKPRRKG